MKNIFLFIFLLFTCALSAQNIQADKVKIKSGGQFTIDGYTIHGVSNDPTLGDSSTLELVTEAVVKAYVDAAMSGGGGSDQDSLISASWDGSTLTLTLQSAQTVTATIATVVSGSGAPGGSPGTGQRVYVDTSNDVLYFNNGGAWEMLDGTHINITDAGGYYTGTEVETALQEIGNPATILAKLLTVDGTGSGLDADLLDSQEGAFYLDLDNGTNDIATAQIEDDAVTYAKLQNISATSRFIGRITAGAGNAEELTGTQATTLLDVFVGDSGAGGTKGVVPAPAAGDAAAGKYLDADGTWTVPSAGVSGTGAANRIAYWSGTNSQTYSDRLEWYYDGSSEGMMVITAPSSGWWVPLNIHNASGNSAQTLFRIYSDDGVTNAFKVSGDYTDIDNEIRYSNPYLGIGSSTAKVNINANSSSLFRLQNSSFSSFANWNPGTGDYTAPGFIQTSSKIQFGGSTTYISATSGDLALVTPSGSEISMNAEGGSTDMFIDEAKVGIGTVVPVNRLDVEGGMAVGASYSGTVTAPTNGMVIEGNLGIGSSDAESELHVEGAASPTFALIRSVSDLNAGIYLENEADDDDSWAFYRQASGVVRLSRSDDQPYSTESEVYMDIGNSEVRIHQVIQLGASGDLKIFWGSGSPESSISAGVGSTYHRTDGGSGTSYYVKESGTGNTGWVAK